MLGAHERTARNYRDQAIAAGVLERRGNGLAVVPHAWACVLRAHPCIVRVPLALFCDRRLSPTAKLVAATLEGARHTVITAPDGQPIRLRRRAFLHSARSLATELGVSKRGVEKALAKLRKFGIVNALRSSGWVGVREVKPAPIGNSFGPNPEICSDRPANSRERVPNHTRTAYAVPEPELDRACDALALGGPDFDRRRELQREAREARTSPDADYARARAVLVEARDSGRITPESDRLAFSVGIDTCLAAGFFTRLPTGDAIERITRLLEDRWPGRRKGAHFLQELQSWLSELRSKVRRGGSLGAYAVGALTAPERRREIFAELRKTMSEREIQKALRKLREGRR